MYCHAYTGETWCLILFFLKDRLIFLKDMIDSYFHSPTFNDHQKYNVPSCSCPYLSFFFLEYTKKLCIFVLRRIVSAYINMTRPPPRLQKSPTRDYIKTERLLLLAYIRDNLSALQTESAHTFPFGGLLQ